MGKKRVTGGVEAANVRPSTVDDATGEFAESGLVVSSRERGWRKIEVMRGWLSSGELAVPGLGSVTVAINQGRTFNLRGKIEGRTSRASMDKGGALIVPAGASSEWRWEGEEPLDMLHLSVTPDLSRKSPEKSVWSSNGSRSRPRSASGTNASSRLDSRYSRNWKRVVREIDSTPNLWRMYWRFTCSGTTRTLGRASSRMWNPTGKTVSPSTRFGESPTT